VVGQGKTQSREVPFFLINQKLKVAINFQFKKPLKDTTRLTVIKKISANITSEELGRQFSEELRRCQAIQTRRA